MGGSSSQPSGTHVVNSAPWGPTHPYFQQGLRDLQYQYGKGYPGASPGVTAPFTKGQQSALQQIQNLGLGNQPLLNQAAWNAGQGMNFQDPTLGQWAGRTGYQNQALGGWQNMVNNPFSNEAMDLVRKEASGANVGGNPYLDRMYDKASQAAVDRYQDTTVPGIVSGMVGRLGSGSFANQLNKAEDTHNRGLTDLATDMYGRAYEGDRSRQLQSQGLLGQLSQQDFANRTSALQNLQSGQQLQEQMQRDALARYGQGAYNQQQMRQSWSDRANPYTMNFFNPIKQALGAGSIEQQQREKQLQDRRRQWQEQNFGPMQWTQNYLQTLGGVGGLGGMQQQPIYSNQAGSMLGGAATGAGIGSAFGPWGTGIGAGLGALGGLLF